MPSNSKEYQREYMRKQAGIKVECQKCHKMYTKTLRYKHVQTKYHNAYKNDDDESGGELTVEDILKFKAFVDKLEKTL